MSMEKLFYLYEMKYSQASKIERRQINTSVETVVKKMADALNIEVKELFNFKVYSNSGTKLSTFVRVIT